MASTKKIKKIIILLIVALVAVMCRTQKKAVYELPEAMLPHVKVVYEQRCEKGYALWKLNCAKCHTQKIKGKTVIPDFNPDQLTGYTIRVANKRHESN